METGSKIIKFEDVQGSIVRINETNVIIDADVARLYEVETKRVNEAVKNNPDKFPDGYIFTVDGLLALLEKKISLLFLYMELYLYLCTR